MPEAEAEQQSVITTPHAVQSRERTLDDWDCILKSMDDDNEEATSAPGVDANRQHLLQMMQHSSSAVEHAIDSAESLALPNNNVEGATATDAP
jgi:hypothetical protein